MAMIDFREEPSGSIDFQPIDFQPETPSPPTVEEPGRKLPSWIRPTLEAGGSALGTVAGVAATPFAGPAAPFLGGGLGYMAGEKIADIAETFVGARRPEGVAEQVKRLPSSAVTAAKYEALGLVGGRALTGLIGKVISPLSKETAAGTKTARELPKEVIERVGEVKRAGKEYGYEAMPSEIVQKAKSAAMLESVLGYSPFSGDVIMSKRMGNLDKLNQARIRMIEEGKSDEAVEALGSRIQGEAEKLISKYSGAKGAELNKLTDDFMKQFGGRRPLEVGQTLGDIIDISRKAISGDVSANYKAVEEMLPMKGMDVIPVSKETLSVADNILKKELSSLKPNMDIVKTLVTLKARDGKMVIPPGINQAMIQRNPELLAIIRESQGLKGEPLRWEGAKLTASRLGEEIDDIIKSRGGIGTTETTYKGMLKRAIEADMENAAKTAGPDVWASYLKAKESSKAMHEIFPEDFLKLLNKPAEDILDKIVKSGEVQLIQQVKGAAGEPGINLLRQGFFRKLIDSSKMKDTDIFDPLKLKNNLNKMGEDTLNTLLQPRQKQILLEMAEEGKRINLKYDKFKKLQFLEDISKSTPDKVVDLVLKPENIEKVGMIKQILPKKQIDNIVSSVLERKILKVAPVVGQEGGGNFLPQQSAKEFTKYRTVLKDIMEPDQFAALSDFVKFGQNANRLQELAINSSKTGQVGIGYDIIRKVIGVGEATVAAAAGISGAAHPVMAAGVLATSVGIPYLVSKAYTSPQAMRYLTSAMKLPPDSPLAIAQFIKGINIIAGQEEKPPASSLSSLSDKELIEAIRNKSGNREDMVAELKRRRQGK